MKTITSRRAVWLVTKRELNTRLRTRSFVVGTAVMLVLLVGYLLLQMSLASTSGKSTVGLTGQATGIAEQLRTAGTQSGQQIETVTIAGPAEGRAKVDNGDIDALLSGTAADLTVLSKSELDSKLLLVLNGISRQEVLNAQLSEAGLDPAQVARTVSAAHVTTETIKPADAESGQRQVLALVIGMLLYIGLITYGTLVAQGVVEEKSSRVVEILLSTVRPWQLLLGKVIGLGLVGLTQLAILGGVGLVAASLTGVLTISGVAVSALLWGLLWFLLGFFLYATIYGALGSLVSRQEDTQAVVGPVNIVLILAFVAGFSLVGQSPDGSVTKIVSLIPLMSPILMPARIATGSAAGWEIGLSVLLTLATIAAVTWIGGRIYQNSVLRIGSRIKLADALRG
ncbi:ABC transporter permease [Amycolatopsis sp. H20-H5]|uniref:ABC transporter permease n=1 Tax=Amycolatopsis sp. H20-H5 TaxID=3046309 RepID=UPI002DB86A6A|nr:ABC transporter permease [Amycolatopsis sp. H20-H5]MEC3979597.1 ABC transporter permease [Amycolatopsis sp. H20-H5]